MMVLSRHTLRVTHQRELHQRTNGVILRGLSAAELHTLARHITGHARASMTSSSQDFVADEGDAKRPDHELINAKSGGLVAGILRMSASLPAELATIYTAMALACAVMLQTLSTYSDATLYHTRVILLTVVGYTMCTIGLGTLYGALRRSRRVVGVMQFANCIMVWAL
jgi:hypothetical protein